MSSTHQKQDLIRFRKQDKHSESIYNTNRKQSIVFYNTFI